MRFSRGRLQEVADVDAVDAGVRLRLDRQSWCRGWRWGSLWEASWWVTFVFESIGGSSPPLLQRMRWRVLTSHWGRDASRDASGVLPLEVVDMIQSNVGRKWSGCECGKSSSDRQCCWDCWRLMRFDGALKASRDGGERLARGPLMVSIRIPSLKSLGWTVWRQERVMCEVHLDSRIRDPGGDSFCGEYGVVAARGGGERCRGRDGEVKTPPRVLWFNRSRYMRK